MNRFRVVRIMEGAAFEVPLWRWNNKTGSRVYLRGALKPFSNPYPENLTDRLGRFLLGKEVDLKNVEGIHDDGLICDVYYHGVDLCEIFPEIKKGRVPVSQARETP